MFADHREGKFFHVVHSKYDDRWYVKEGCDGTVISYSSEDEAVKKATELAQTQNSQNQHVVIHKVDGAFESYAKLYHVLHSKQDDQWHVKEGNGGTIISCVTKEEAVKKATELAEAEKTQRKQIIIHKTNGAFEAIKTFN